MGARLTVLSEVHACDVRVPGVIQCKAALTFMRVLISRSPLRPLYVRPPRNMDRILNETVLMFGKTGSALGLPFIILFFHLPCRTASERSVYDRRDAHETLESKAFVPSHMRISDERRHAFLPAFLLLPLKTAPFQGIMFTAVVLCMDDDLLIPPPDAPIGELVTVKGHPPTPSKNERAVSMIWEKVLNEELFQVGDDEVRDSIWGHTSCLCFFKVLDVCFDKCLAHLLYIQQKILNFFLVKREKKGRREGAGGVK